jgi:glutamine---fructose-6-phosphate transaminase (isomerizing)
MAYSGTNEHMCGIVAYTGNKPASPILIDGLRVLEYRGYDSAGIYVPGSGCFKAVGSVQDLVLSLPGMLPGHAGIGHTRWATHGKPSVENAHPHHDFDRAVWLVHNGIIENYTELRERLIEEGHTFSSETDTEVLAHLVGDAYERSRDLPAAVVEALTLVQGTYGIAVMAEDMPNTIVTASLGSPIAIGVKEGEYIIASDTAPIVRHTREVIYLKDGEYAVLSPEGYGIFSFSHEVLNRKPETVNYNIEDVQKGGHPHFMLKEILEIPTVLENTARGRIVMREGNAKLGGLTDKEELLRTTKCMIIVGCGSAYYAGMVGKLLIEDLTGIPVQVELGSEFRNRAIVAKEGTTLVAISQSGETADTLGSVREAKRRGIPTIGIVNVVGSTIARETDVGIYNHAGPEIGVASTKAFLSQLEVLSLFALYLGRLRGMTQARGAEFAMELIRLPEKVRTILNDRHKIKALAEAYLGYDDFLYIGRGYNLPTAYEGALKLKEVSYVHAEGYGAGEMKHGPIAMIDEVFPTIAIMPSDSTYAKMCSNVEEIRARNGPVIAIATEGNTAGEALVDDVIYIPDTRECLTPILANVPLQLFAYYTGVLRGFNVDRPRNLAKSVTVE